MAFAGRSVEHPPEEVRPLQWPAAAAIAVTFGALTFGLIQGAQAGFRDGVVGVRARRSPAWRRSSPLERRSASPLLPPELLRRRLFVVANVYTLLVYAALGGTTFYLALYLQSRAVGYTPARASLIFLPISIVMFLLAARFGRLADRDGPRRVPDARADRDGGRVRAAHARHQHEPARPAAGRARDGRWAWRCWSRRSRRRRCGPPPTATPGSRRA